MSRQKSDRELEQIQSTLEYQDTELRVFLAEVLSLDSETREKAKDKMLELENLVTTYGGVVILEHFQNKTVPDYDLYLWEWKLDEIVTQMELKKSNLLILWNILKPHQVYNLNQKLKPIWAKAWDRVDLILKIFERHAKSAESKLQIELAAIKHMWPRIFGMGMELSKQWWWVWTRGKWETNTEIMKRHLRKKEDNIRKELEKFKKVRAQHRQSRLRKWLFTVGIVGYTNAWKSSLLNSLTHKWVLAEDKLFATLWTSVSKLHINYDEISEDIKKNLNLWEYVWVDLLLNDTIWFIRELPPKLIEAFSSTLEDSIESKILLHVIDASDPKVHEKVWVVDDILSSIWANQEKIYVFNKIDLLEPSELEKLKTDFLDLNPIFISSHKKINFQELKDVILKSFYFLCYKRK